MRLTIKIICTHVLCSILFILNEYVWPMPSFRSKYCTEWAEDKRSIFIYLFWWTLIKAFILKILTRCSRFRPVFFYRYPTTCRQTWTIPVKVKKEVSWAIQSTDRRLREPVKVKMLTRSLFLAFFVIFATVDAQYEKYSFKSFPQKDIMPLESAYNYAMEQYGAQNWAETIKFLELSLRLHRLLRDSEAFCCSNCSSVSRDNDTLFEDTSLRVMRHILLRAACLKKCKADFPVFKLTYPRRDLLETFEKRIPYRYIQYAYFQVRLSVEVSSLGLWECNAKLVQYLSTAYHKTILRVTGALIQQKRLQLASLDRLARFTYREEISSGLAVECNFATTLLCALLLAKQQLSMCHVSSSVPLKTIPLFFCQSDGGGGYLVGKIFRVKSVRKSKLGH